MTDSALYSIVVALWIGAAISMLFVAYHYYRWVQEFEQARLTGKLRAPEKLLWGEGRARRHGLEHFIAFADIVPKGEVRRRKVLWGLGGFGLFAAGFVMIIIVHGPFTR